jgi:hypothetical protein
MIADENETAPIGTAGTRAASGGGQDRLASEARGAATTTKTPIPRADLIAIASEKTGTLADATDAIESGIAIGEPGGTRGGMTRSGPRGVTGIFSMTGADPEIGTTPSRDATSGGAHPLLPRNENPLQT